MGKPLRWQYVILKLNEYENEPKEQWEKESDKSLKEKIDCLGER